MNHPVCVDRPSGAERGGAASAIPSASGNVIFVLMVSSSALENASVKRRARRFPGFASRMTVF